MSSILSEVVYLITGAVSVFLFAMEILMMVRAVLSWLPTDEDGPFSTFVNTVTEPVVYPVRALFEKLNLFQNLPIDLSFFVAFLLLTLVEALLPAVIV